MSLAEEGAGVLFWPAMKGLLLLLIHLLAVLARLAGPGGTRGLVAENLLMKQQLLVLGRTRRRAPNLSPLERFVLGLCTLFISPSRLPKVAAGVRPSTLLKLHQRLVRRKYRALFSSRRSSRRPGPKGPSEEVVQIILELKRHNPLFGCPRIALIIAATFGVDVDKDVVRRVLEKHLRPGPSGGGPSWLTLIGHAKDSLWSVDLFRCESILLKTHRVLVVMDQFTRRIIGFAVHVGDVDGLSLYRRYRAAWLSFSVTMVTATLPDSSSTEPWHGKPWRYTRLLAGRCAGSAWSNSVASQGSRLCASRGKTERQFEL